VLPQSREKKVDLLTLGIESDHALCLEHSLLLLQLRQLLVLERSHLLLQLLLQPELLMQLQLLLPPLIGLLLLDLQKP
jgi:hypothetical protein